MVCLCVYMDMWGCGGENPLSRNSAIKADGGRLICFLGGVLAGGVTKLVIPSCVRSPCVSRNSRFSISFSKAVELMYFGKQERVWQVCCCGFAARAPPALCSSPSRGSHGVWTQFSVPGRLVCAAATSGSPFAAVRVLVLMLEGFFSLPF